MTGWPSSTASLLCTRQGWPSSAQTISSEMGAPMSLAMAAQAPAGLGHMLTARRVLAEFEFEQELGTTLLVREPIGVCALITPWNWPMNQIACKVAPAIAAGCTMVLKPTEVAPLNAVIFAEMMDEAGVPAGVFNLVNGDGADRRCCAVVAPRRRHGVVHRFDARRHRGGQNAAPTVKRVAQELGGKSANILLDDADFDAVVARGMSLDVQQLGQSCNAPTRMLVPARADGRGRGDRRGGRRGRRSRRSRRPKRRVGPVVSEVAVRQDPGAHQEGHRRGRQARGRWPGRPEGLDNGYFVKPTVFSHVTNDMTIAREEIFGPVLVIIGYKDDDDAVRIANDTAYGLSGLRARGRRPRPQRRASDPQLGTSTSTARPATSTHRSAATSSPATVASGASSVSRSFSRPRRSWATAPDAVGGIACAERRNSVRACREPRLGGDSSVCGPLGVAGERRS